MKKAKTRLPSIRRPPANACI